jgi:hypothetical protein
MKSLEGGLKMSEGVRKAIDEEFAKLPGTGASGERGECHEELSGLVHLGSFVFLFMFF